MNLDVAQGHYSAGEVLLHFYEIDNDLPALILLHAQGTDALSYEGVFRKLAKHFHLIAIDCPGHGQSDKNKEHYNIRAIGNAIVDFMEHQVKSPAFVLGHSSGGLIAAYVAANTRLCAGLVLEDPPFFSSQGKRRFTTFNYLDLSTVCHNYIEESITEDFVVYYFEHQKMWEFFPDNSREKIKAKSVASARKFRAKHPDRSLKVPFFPKSALAAYKGMNDYDPFFGETFYNDTFHAGISHESILKDISCKTLLMKAKTDYSDDGVLLAAMADEDAVLLGELIPECKTERFDCGHGVHIEKEKEFLEAVITFAK